jgi:hypothetical protein
MQDATEIALKVYCINIYFILFNSSILLIGLTSPLILLKNVAEKIGVKYDLIEDTLVEYSQQMQLYFILLKIFLVINY